MLQRNNGPIGFESEPTIDQTRPEGVLPFVREMNVLRLDDPAHARSPFAQTPVGAWSLVVETKRDKGIDPSSKLAGHVVGNLVDMLPRKTERVSFIVHGNNEIRRRIDESIANMPDDCRPSDELVEFFKISNLGAFANRIDKNGNLDIGIDDLGLEDYNRLTLGTGLPIELAGIFDRHYKDLLSLELAKQTVGMRWNQTDNMDNAVVSAAIDKGYSGEKSKLRYYYTAGLSAIEGQGTRERAGIYVRKQELGSKPVDGGRLVLMQRDSFMVDFHHRNMRSLLPAFNEWYKTSLINEWGDDDGYEHFEPLGVSEDEVVEMIRANTKRIKCGDARGGSGLKTPISGGNSDSKTRDFGDAVAAKIESAIAIMANSDLEVSPDLGVYMANRSYYVYFESF